MKTNLLKIVLGYLAVRGWTSAAPTPTGARMPENRTLPVHPRPGPSWLLTANARMVAAIEEGLPVEPDGSCLYRPIAEAPGGDGALIIGWPSHYGDAREMMRYGGWLLPGADGGWQTPTHFKLPAEARRAL